MPKKGQTKYNVGDLINGRRVLSIKGKKYVVVCSGGHKVTHCCNRLERTKCKLCNPSNKGRGEFKIGHVVGDSQVVDIVNGFYTLKCPEGHTSKNTATVIRARKRGCLRCERSKANLICVAGVVLTLAEAAKVAGVTKGAMRQRWLRSHDVEILTR